jgi:hypothetical protein
LPEAKTGKHATDLTHRNPDRGRGFFGLPVFLAGGWDFLYHRKTNEERPMASEIEHRGSVLFGVPRGMTGQLASRLIDDGVIEELIPRQNTYQETRRKEVRRVLFNLIRAQSLSRAHSRRITLAVPLTMIHRSEKEYHRVSYRGVKSVIEAFSGAGLVDRERGKPFWQCPTKWKKKCVRQNNLGGEDDRDLGTGKTERGNQRIPG